jgi:hypothetical protein
LLGEYCGYLPQITPSGFTCEILECYLPDNQVFWTR